MLSKSNRLTRYDVDRLKTGAKRIHGTYATMVYVPGHEQKYAVVVSKKVAKHAVDRHLLKRRVYASLRSTTLPFVTGMIILKPGALTAPYPDLTRDIIRLIAATHT